MFAISNVCFAQSYNNVEEEMLEEETLEYSVSSSNGLPDNVTDEIFVFLETVGNAMLDAIIDFFNIGIWWISALALPLPLLTAFIIKRMRKADKLYKHPQRYYLLYLGGVVLTFISSYPYAVYMEIYDITHLTVGHILLSIGVSSFSSLAIFAGWGIRQCGMISGKYHRNFNRYIVFLNKTNDFSGELLPETDEGRVFWIEPDKIKDMNLSSNFANYLPMFMGEKNEAFGSWNEDDPEILLYK